MLLTGLILKMYILKMYSRKVPFLLRSQATPSAALPHNATIGMGDCKEAILGVSGTL
jgi:hypothetical protein